LEIRENYEFARPPGARVVDIAHRAAFFYCFASLAIARLIEFSPFNAFSQTIIVAFLLGYFLSTVSGYI